MATGTPAPYVLDQFFDDNGKPLNGGTIETFIAGTATHQATYSDVTLLTAYGNPVTLNSAGRFPSNGSWFWIPGASYKVLIKNAAGTTIATPDSQSSVPGSGAGTDLTGTSGETLTAGKAVYLSDGSGGKTTGLWYLADSANTYSSTTPEVGLVPATIASGASGTIRIGGQVTGLTSLTVGTSYYVGTAGAITTSAPANRRFLGVADTTSSLVITPNPPQSGPGSALTLAAHGVVIGNGTSAVTATAVGATGTVLTGVTGADPVYTAATSVGVWQLLKANSGTNTAAVATNVDTFALTGLTAKDILKVEVTLKSVTAGTAGISLYNSTDAVSLLDFDGGITAGDSHGATLTAKQSQASATEVVTWCIGRTPPAILNSINAAAFTTAWTGSWTIALRHAGVTATGTLQWQWNLYKLVGQ